MTRLYLLLYRLCFAFEDLAAMLWPRRWPRLTRKLKRIDSLLKRYALPKLRVLVRVQSGLSQGMWLRVHLPEEASYWRGNHESRVQEAISAVVQPGAVVYDVGAHIGMIALGAARLVGEGGCVVAFDGDPDNAASLRENCFLNHFETRIQVVHAAVWSYATRDGISFRRGTSNHRSQGGVEADGHRPVLGSGETVKVPAITLDDFIAVGPSPQLVKIDVEGGEYEILRGGEKLFVNRRPRIILEVHRRHAAEQITGWLQSLRYRAEWDIPEQGFPRTLFAWPEESREAGFTRRSGSETAVIAASKPDRTRGSETTASHLPKTGLQSY
jgi:FkbM family methyltransferase